LPINIKQGQLVIPLNTLQLKKRQQSLDAEGQ